MYSRTAQGAILLGGLVFLAAFKWTARGSATPPAAIWVAAVLVMIAAFAYEYGHYQHRKRQAQSSEHGDPSD